MAPQFVLTLDHIGADLETVGGKGASLARLTRAGFPVPEGFHVTTEAYRQFVTANEIAARIEEALAQVDLQQPSTLEQASSSINIAFMDASIPEDIASAIVGAYGDLSGTNPAVAVRSSATAEDLPEASFAGQQESFLNVNGADLVLEAVKKCWSSLWTPRAIGYRRRQGIQDEGVALAVVVQRLVEAEVAGILFTANPKDGNPGQIQISAAWGLGDAVVGGRVNSDDFILKKETGEIVSEEIGDKEIMTVRSHGATVDQPVPENLRRLASLQEPDLVELARFGRQIEELYGTPMDIEWALADGHIAILQARPITGLPDVYVPPPEEWELPAAKGRYMRASIVDMMPNPLSPLFATMGTQVYNQAIYDMMVGVSGREAAFPKEIIIPIQEYAYMRVNFSGREWLAMLYPLTPAIIKGIRGGPEHFRETALPEYQERVDRLSQKLVGELSTQQLWDDARELTAAAMYHLSILQLDTLGASAGSEGLFTSLYTRWFKREGDPAAAAFMMGFDTIPIQSEKSLYDLATWASGHAELAGYLEATPKQDLRQMLAAGAAPPAVPGVDWNEFTRKLNAHLDTFGYILFDLDFEKPLPGEDPGPELETIKLYLRGEGNNPHERQAMLEKQRLEAIEYLLPRLKGVRGWATRKAFNWAQSMGPVREDSIASIGLAYPRLRAVLKELGHRLVRTGATQEPDDIFWLEESEVVSRLEAADALAELPSLEANIAERKKKWKAARKVLPPTSLPPSDSYMGIPVAAFVPGEGGVEGDRLKGVAASGGTVSGPACVLNGPEDFDNMVPGGILVAKLTTPAWTPLFAIAGAVVTDIGGPLSHGSIVAREYGIPAVLGTAAATRLIKDGQEITVDGDKGYVTIPQAA
ncbi:MAG: PEP/pyruvate-binding domain-containing protein [Anaerolineales bacterium]